MTSSAHSEAPSTRHAQRAAPPLVAPPAAAHDGRHDFDFLHGAWRVRNHRLRGPLSGSTEWYSFDGRAIERALPAAQGNLEEYEATPPDAAPIHAVALRLYEPATHRWTIHWSNAATGTLDAPVTGAFRDGVGEFLGHEDYAGRMVLVRFRWTSEGRDAARWEQAFSADAGRTWETNWIMEFTRDDAPAVGAYPVVELRQYAMKPGARDTLVELFERELLETQEDVGMRVLAQFRDVDRPDVFTWLRGFPDMEARRASLHAFYDGPVWAAHRDAANGTMLSSDNVRLLRPVRPETALVAGARPAPGASPGAPDLLVATIYTVRAPDAAGFAGFFEREVAPRLRASGAAPFAMLETESSANTFPRLPVREGEHAFVWLARFHSTADHDRHVAALAADARWTGDVRRELDRRLVGPPEVWRLVPTARSRHVVTTGVARP